MGSDSPIAFIKQSIRDFRTTGAVAPSSAFLARGIASNLPSEMPADFQVLEVGPGTGSITAELVKRMNGRGHLDLFEISPDFCSVLRRRIAEEKLYNAMRQNIQIHEGDVRSLKRQNYYDAVVSGLPFSCFQPDEVRGFIEHFRYLLKPGGALIWFEYVGIRELQSPFVGKKRREQLKGINAVMSSFIREHQYRQQIIPLNLPPARIRHLRFG